MENVEGPFCATVDNLFAQGGITEETHSFLQEVRSLFNKPGCVLYRSSCVCVAGEQGLWDVNSISGTAFFLSNLELREYQKMLKKLPAVGWDQD